MLDEIQISALTSIYSNEILSGKFEDEEFLVDLAKSLMRVRFYLECFSNELASFYKKILSHVDSMYTNIGLVEITDEPSDLETI